MLIKDQDSFIALTPPELQLWDSYNHMAQVLAATFPSAEEKRAYAFLTLDVLNFCAQEFLKQGQESIGIIDKALADLVRDKDIGNPESSLQLVYQINDALISLKTISDSLKHSVQVIFNVAHLEINFCRKQGFTYKTHSLQQVDFYYDFIDKTAKIGQFAKLINENKGFKYIKSIDQFLDFTKTGWDHFLAATKVIATDISSEYLSVSDAMNIVRKFLAHSSCSEGENSPEFTLSAYVLAILLRE